MLLRARLHRGGGPQVSEVTCGGLPHLSCKHDQIKTRDYVDGWVTPPKRVTSPTRGPPPPCKQTLKQFLSWFLRLSLNGFVRFSLKIKGKQRTLRYNFQFNLRVKFVNAKWYSDTKRGTSDSQNNFNLHVRFTFCTISNSFRAQNNNSRRIVLFKNWL